MSGCSRTLTCRGFAVVWAGIIFIPQVFVQNPWQLMGLRFLLGLAVAGLNPSINILIKKITPDSLTGRVFGFSISAGYLGVFGGSVLGGQVVAWWGIRDIFFLTSAFLLLNAVWVYFTVYRKLNRQEAAPSQQEGPEEGAIIPAEARIEATGQKQ